MEKPKGFGDLVFKEILLDDLAHARIRFPNGYGVSVLRKQVDGQCWYELGVTDPRGKLVAIPLISSFTVADWCGPDGITDKMRIIQGLGSPIGE